ncbi:hypothetical protein [Paraburkholderia sacchari]|uniref:hypothetical protein n=1 Tax=Paraburkholderia sacchari TaxID=159450 RepID=UPI001BCADEE4|nr:hypothetical protein [Paraburkholderia sacchari]
MSNPNCYTRVSEAVIGGTLRATVTEIRKYLGCSQARAAAIRKQFEPTTLQS